MNVAQNNVITGPWSDKISEKDIADAASLKPVKMTERASVIWDALAPEMIYLGRLETRFVRLFAEWCYQCGKIEELRDWLDKNPKEYCYTSQGRQGIQYKMHPYVAQVHEHWRQMLRLTEKFGLTPSDEKALQRSVHGDLIDEFGAFND
jgi:phage terminase small subunit